MTTACIADTCTRTLRPHEIAARQYLCDPCTTAIRGWLASIPAQMVVLRASRERETTGQPSVSGSRNAPLPGSPAVLNLLGAWATGPVHDIHGDQHGDMPIAATLYDWVRLVCEERRLRGPRVLSEEALAGWLVEHVGWASTRGWAGELRTELHGMMRTIWAVTALRPRTQAITRPCPRCEQLTLTRTDGDHYTRCTDPDCGTAYTTQELCDDAAARTAA